MTTADKQINVTHIVPHLRNGGAEQMAIHLMTGLDPARFKASAIVLGRRSGSSLEESLDSNGIPTIYLGKKSGFDPRMFLRVRQALRRLRPAVVHTHVHVLRYVLPHLLFRNSHTIVHTVHNIAEREVEPRAQWLQLLAFRSGIVPISVAQEVAVSLERRYRVSNSEVIPNCIPVGRYQLSKEVREEWRRNAGINSTDTVFTCVALFREQKNHQRLLRVFKAGPGRNSGAKLLLVGAGPTEDGIRQLAEYYGLGDQVRFLGMRDDIPEVLGASDVFVLSSDYEGNPLAIMEAMAAGLPIVSTRVGGVPELVAHGRDGILVDPANEAEFKEALQLLFDRPDIRNDMGLCAARHAEEKFDLRFMVLAYERVYMSMCTARLSAVPLAAVM
jgi:glycosyltransferase involved in cell wall biosynthesis